MVRKNASINVIIQRREKMIDRGRLSIVLLSNKRFKMNKGTLLFGVLKDGLQIVIQIVEII